MSTYEGMAGLAAIEEFQPTVVLLDIGMPRMDGYETCRRMRQRFGMRLGIVAISGWGQEHDKQSASAAGFDAHLTKPANPAELEEIIRALSRPR